MGVGKREDPKLSSGIDSGARISNRSRGIIQLFSLADYGKAAKHTVNNGTIISTGFLVRLFKVMHTTPLSMHGRSALDAVAMAYAREVYIRNESQLQGLSHNLVTTFHNASLKFPDKVMNDPLCYHLS